MSDLLASLVDRALDRAPILQRRQPTLFEPVMEAAFNQRPQIETASIEEKDTFVERNPVTEPGRSSFKAQVTNFNAAPPPPEDTGTRNVETQTRVRGPLKSVPSLQAKGENEPPESPQTTTRTESIPNTNVWEERSSRSPVPHEIAELETIAIAPPRMIETIVEKMVEREVVSQPGRATPTIKESQTGDRPSADHQKQTREDDGKAMQLLKVNSKASNPIRNEPTIKPLTRKTPAPRDTSALVYAQSRRDSAPAIMQSRSPAVTVTIGRVEVRAMPQAVARPPAARPAAPEMSLEDYLRSRGEGK
jgi:hypothetical protein